MTDAYDAVIIGAGPNGLAAAIRLASAGLRVLVLEGAGTIGGGCRTAELTLPGFRHDPCSAIHPLAMASPFFRTLPLDQHGLAWIEPPLALAHPFEDGTAAVLSRSLNETANSLGADGGAWERLMTPFIWDFDYLLSALLGPLRLPRLPITLARFGLPAIRSAEALATSRFSGDPARALFAGLAAHSMLRLDQAATASFGIMLGLCGHTVNWPLPRGGSQAIVDALAAHFQALGGDIRTGVTVTSLDAYAQARAILFDVTPAQLLTITGDRLGGLYRRQLEHFQRGVGVFKVDWALNGPVPWTAPDCHRAGTVHLGGTMAEVAAAERQVHAGAHPERPFVIVAQASRFDSTRAPVGKQTLWGYCHVPNGSTVDMTEEIEGQIERFAPGFRDQIVARSTMSAADFEAYNPNYLGGDINGGAQNLRQLFTRPAVRYDPYATPDQQLFLCSASTPPGGGVHGMCGFHAAESVIRRHHPGKS